VRIIAGEFRSRRIQTVRGLDVRPTPDRLRESLFNVLSPRLNECRFVDAYAGCGAVGIEALSRGAGHVTFIEVNPAATRMIRRNVESLGIADGFEIRNARAARVLGDVEAEIVFLDPPYELEAEYQSALDALAAVPPPLVIAQHATRHPLLERYGPLGRTRVLRQGDNSLSFYEPD
jgi:16S rRNA (guanine(966)-N(2))-methyltransferase RsmD